MREKALARPLARSFAQKRRRFFTARRNMAVRAFQPLAFRAADNERAPSRARALPHNRYFLPLTAPRPAAFPRPPPVSTGGRSRMPQTQPGTSWDVDRPPSSSLILDVSRYVPAYRFANIARHFGGLILQRRELDNSRVISLDESNF